MLTSCGSERDVELVARAIVVSYGLAWSGWNLDSVQTGNSGWREVVQGLEKGNASQSLGQRTSCERCLCAYSIDMPPVESGYTFRLVFI